MVDLLLPGREGPPPVCPAAAAAAGGEGGQLSNLRERRGISGEAERRRGVELPRESERRRPL